MDSNCYAPCDSVCCTLLGHLGKHVVKLASGDLWLAVLVRVLREQCMRQPLLRCTWQGHAVWWEMMLLRYRTLLSILVLVATMMSLHSMDVPIMIL